MRITYITNFNIFDPTSPSQQIRATLWLIADYLPVSCLAIFRLARNGLQWWSWPRKVGWCHQRVRLPRTALKRVAVLKLIVDNCRNDAKSRIAGNWLQSGTAHSFLKGNLSHSETVLSSEEQTHPSSCYKFWHALAWHALDHHDFRALNHSILSLWVTQVLLFEAGQGGPQSQLLLSLQSSDRQIEQVTATVRSWLYTKYRLSVSTHQNICTHAWDSACSGQKKC